MRYVDILNSHYAISDTGEVLNKKTNHVMVATIDKNQPRLTLLINGVPSNTRIKRLVAKYFVPNPNNYQYIAFKDGDTLNCNATNLYWVETYQEERQTFRKKPKPEFPETELRPEFVPEVKDELKRGVCVKTLAFMYGVSTAAIVHIRAMK